MIRLLGILAFALSVSAAQSARSETLLDLRICHTQGSSEDLGWWHSSIKQIGRVYALSGSNTKIELRRAPCNSTMPDSSCAGREGGMFCRQSSLDRVHNVSAYLALSFMQSNASSYESFRRQNPRAVAAGFQFADGAVEDANMSDGVERIRSQLEAEASGQQPAPGTGVPADLANLVRSITHFAITALIGHESYHANGDRCMLSDKTDFETNGIFAHSLSLQNSDTLFCESNADPNEIKADRCAMRFLSKTSTDGLSAQRDQIARRLAADIIAFQSLFGFRKFPQLSAGQYVVPKLDQYLHPTFRLALLSGSLTHNQSGPRICGEAAGLFVTSVQQIFQQCPGNGEVTDELLSLLPSGVETSWNGAPWTLDTFSCVND